MSAEAWILFSVLAALLVGVTTQFGRLLVFLLNTHRAERKEENDSNRLVISELTKAIRDASSTTTIFQAEVDKANVNTGQGKQNN